MERSAIWLRRLLFLGAALYPATYLVVALSRLFYPFELEWMEGGVLGHVNRILAGQPLYPPPSFDFVAFVYPPLYYYCGAAATLLLGHGFFPLRLISLLASLASMALIFLFVRKETGRSGFAFLSMALYAASFGASGAWFDLARVDSLFVFFTLAGIYLIRFSDTWQAHAAAALFLAAAFFTKQTALVFTLALFLPILFPPGGGKRFLFPALFFMLVAAGCALLQRASHGWFALYAFKIPEGHPWVKRVLLDFWGNDMARPFGITLFLSILFLAPLWRNKDRRFLFFGGLLGSALISAFLSRLHSGGASNVLMPLHAVLALLFGPALMAFSRPKDGLQQNPLTTPAVLLALLQFAALFYFPDKQIPARRDREAGLALVETLKNFKGEVFVPNHGYLSVMAGKKDYAQAMAMNDILLSGEDSIKTRVEKEMRGRILSGNFEAIVLDDTTWKYFDEVRKRYDFDQPAVTNDSLFWPVTGMPTRPEQIYILKTPVE